MDVIVKTLIVIVKRVIISKFCQEFFFSSQLIELEVLMDKIVVVLVLWFNFAF